MKEFICISNNGVQGIFGWEKNEDDFWDEPVDQFSIRDAAILQGLPFTIKVKETENEVRILYQDNNGQSHLTGKGITEGMLKEFYDYYKNKNIVSSSNIKPIYKNEGRAPNTMDKTYKRLEQKGVVSYDRNQDIYHYPPVGRDL